MAFIAAKQTGPIAECNKYHASLMIVCDTINSVGIVTIDTHIHVIIEH